MIWNDNLTVGIDSIDGQHKELFKRINDLVDAIKKGICRKTIGDVIKFLEDYILVHFGEEEKFMIDYNYPDYPQHKEQHMRFMENFSELKMELIKLEGGKRPGSYDLSVETNKVVVDWILDHIAKVDKKLGEFLRTKI